MEIKNSTIEDIDAIFDLYDDAIEYQKKVFNKSWESFDYQLVETEIKEQRQWKIIMDGEIASIFVITFGDPAIWKEKDLQPSLYIHRIVTSSKFRGAAFMYTIIEWAKKYADDNCRQFIRIDTWAKIKDS